VNEPEVIRDMLGDPETENLSIAVIGLSENPAKPSNYVAAYMLQHGYRILPVNPSIKRGLGEKAYPSLTTLVESGVKPDIVNVFLLPSFIPAIVDEMLALGLKDLWVQQGIIHLDAAARAEAGGIRVVMDRCIMVEHRYNHS
jgi:predicted CoA-binding protein